MLDILKPSEWGRALGLAVGRLFAVADHPAIGQHRMLLDGADGCFAFSSYADAIDEEPFRNWAWSSGVLHHVTVLPDRIVVRRWDDPQERRSYRPSSVAAQMREFYLMLTKERSRISMTLDQHAVDIFRRLRSRQDAPQAVGLFLFLLATMIRGKDEVATDNAEEIIQEHGIDGIAGEDVRRLGADFWRETANRFRLPSFAYDDLSTLPSLVLRHAGSRIFQEAHFELVRAGEGDLFDYAAPAVVDVTARGGVHFTPPGIARFLTEQCVSLIDPIGVITILDPACGSGAFLLEAARFFQDRNPNVSIRLIGFDVSRFAISMARFALTQLKREWQGLDLDFSLTTRDALNDEPWPTADVILTNPPFIAWPDLTSDQRIQVRRWVVDHSGSGPQRPDISMAFVARGLISLSARGVLGSLLPGGVLGMDTAQSWRKSIASQSYINFLALLNEHGLFQYATVELGALVLSRQLRSTDCISLWASPRRGASSEVLRELRRQGNAIQSFADSAGGDWSIYRRTSEEVASEPSWRPRPYRLASTLAYVEKMIETKVGDLFHIRQGVRTGHRNAFLLEESEYSRLSATERRFFRPVIENDNIRRGQIIEGEWIFYPETDGLPQIETDDDLEKLVPEFAIRLAKYREILKRRKGAKNWWSLTRPRGWLRKPKQKLVTTYFGESGSFTFDRRGDGVVVQGHGWLPKQAIEHELAAMQVSTGTGTLRPLSYEKNIAPAYVALLNSMFFETLLREFCPTVGGGQCNLSAIFVNQVPLPNLAELARPASQFERHMGELAKFGNRILDGEQLEDRLLEELIRDIYRISRR